MTGIPSIAIGVVAYALIVVPSHSYSGLSASFALAILMLPIMIRANEVAMATVPDDLKEAGLALGVRKSRVARSVVLRARSAASFRAISWPWPAPWAKPPRSSSPPWAAHAHGHQPPAADGGHPAVHLHQRTQPQASLQTTAWATALVLLLFVVVLSIIGRSIASHLNRHAR